MDTPASANGLDGWAFGAGGSVAGMSASWERGGT